MEWAIWLTVVLTLLVFKPTRTVALWVFFLIPMLVFFAFRLSEPDLTD